MVVNVCIYIYIYIYIHIYIYISKNIVPYNRRVFLQKEETAANM